MLRPGTLLQNRYRILQQIGGGGMGLVYLAEDARLRGLRCAIKEMNPSSVALQDRKSAIKAFQQEAQILARLHHPGIATVTDFFPQRRKLYLVMRYVEGETLKQHVEQQPDRRLEVGDALVIARQLCEVLAYLHSQTPPVVFRDLKPENVMITPNGDVKLIDFGIARFFKPWQPWDTMPLGTPGYAAPEQYDRTGQTDARTDIYGFGMLLYWLLTGYDPAVASSVSPGLRNSISELPAYIEAVIVRATQLCPEERYQSVGDLCTALLAAVPLQEGSEIASLPAQMLVDSGTRTLGLSSETSSVPLVSRVLVPLSSTLEEATETVSARLRHDVVGNILRHALQLLRAVPVEGHSLLLVGYPGVGTTTVIKQLKKAILEDRRFRNRIIVAHVSFKGELQPADPARILRELKRERGELETRLRNAVQRAAQVQDGSHETSRKFKLGLPLEFTASIPSITFTFKEPVAYESVSTWKSPVSSEQRSLLVRLRELIDYLTEEGGRIVLVLDKAREPGVVEPLRGLLGTPGVFTIITTERANLAEWESHDPYRRAVHYLPCLWSVTREIIDRLLGDSDQRDSDAVQSFIRYLEFCGRGLPGMVVTELGRFYQSSFCEIPGYSSYARPVLQLPKDRLQEIEGIARVQTALEWGAIFRDREGRDMLAGSDPSRLDQARLGVYSIVDWVLECAKQRECFGLAKLQARARESDLPLADSAVRIVVQNLLKVLKDAGLRQTSRGLDATGLLCRQEWLRAEKGGPDDTLYWPNCQ